MAQMHWEGTGGSEIANVLGRDKGTISREFKRNASLKYRCYTPCQAQKRTDARRAGASRSPRLKEDSIRQYVEKKLSAGWSPELIAGRLGMDHPGKTISYEAMYPYIYHPTTEDRPRTCPGFKTPIEFVASSVALRG